MHLFRFLVTFFALLAAVPSFAGHGPAPAFDIRVEGGDWGDASPKAIERTLHEAAGVLLPYLSAVPMAPIVVTHTSGPPVTLYERGPNGEYLVQLHASGTNWHLYVYEFAHELTHILSNYDRNAGPSHARHNQWLEESLCETASLFVLNRLSAAWKLSPVDEMASRAGTLQLFFETLIGETHRRLPSGYTLAAWLGAIEARLRADPYQRQHDDLVARHLLPLFERDPHGWEALRYLNLAGNDNEATLAQYLVNWYGNAPSTQKPFVGAVLKALTVGSPS